MCTLSFLPQKDAYFAAMNRDERKDRAIAFPPSVHYSLGLSLVYPRESGGGTWIGGNSRGTLLAMLNWYGMANRALGPKNKSRGEIIPMILPEPNSESADRALAQLNLAGFHPFRLFGFFPADRQIHEWCWDTRHLVRKSHEWGRHHWFSSSRSDAQAEKERGNACERTWRDDPATPADWLRQLHASHIPDPGPFSICVHREDAATVSYTEVQFRRGELQMRYLSGNPCQASTRGLDAARQGESSIVRIQAPMA